ncbi:restriction endonuclease subunit S [Xanthomonas campestris pv. campestris]|uniref:restriction endonuclease subunit S n=1 Tax=Xanthomonas campestris TaxID=339 RepID=UPI00160C850B|nr:restriction endonuclease subunit S [Xanthomonas campestris]MEB1197371.1 restriction endonuclease subunit S [Xanthomonas campestris pv. campestris]MEA9532844.1 restriction endonuclease subunit S [Xanthomonas campestris]MEB1267813.1 restriction endonuclease subunit S [Xanthomonas campestris pv. campestris]MEB1279850.1 restriction endonuclease subunit S [Xanthomonas campestris pv. campestris]MEB1344429.1 restriction endonuclease subunit S [Xanthomonas campestris pv. campestris]
MTAPRASVLPQGWTRRRLRFDCLSNPVKSKLDIPDDTEVSFVPMDAVGELGGLRLDQTRELADVYNGYTYFADGDVCIAKITPCFENGKGAIAEGLVNGVAFGTTELHVLRPSATLDTRFLFYLTIAHDFRSHGEAEMLGASGQKRVPEEFLKDWTPSLPRMDVQQRIARFLDDKTARIDALIEKKQELLERLEEKRRALITSAVMGKSRLRTQAKNKTQKSGGAWLGAAPSDWKVKRLRFAFESCKNGVWGAEPDDEDSIVCIRAADFDGQSGRLNNGNRTLRTIDKWSFEKVRLNFGDLILEKSGGGDKQLVGRAVLFDGNTPSVCSNFLARCRPRIGFHHRFLNYLMLAIYLGRGTYPHIKQSTGIQNIDTGSYFDMRVAIPEENIQIDISNFLDESVAAIDVIRSCVIRSIEKLNDFRSIVITAAVTGQLPELNG